VHVLPSPLLVEVTADYLNLPEGRVIKNPTAEVLKDGVTMISAATLVARMLAFSGPGLPEDVVLYVDECHNSDAYTYLVRVLGVGYGAIRSVVLASASHSGSGFRRIDDGGTTVHEFEHKRLEEWSYMDENVPWAVDYIAHTGNVVIFCDERERLNTLLNEYETSGLVVCHLKSDMSLRDYLNMTRGVKGGDTRIKVFVADYSFRSGFTLPAQTIIDAGFVAFRYEDKGGVAIGRRLIYSVEEYQSRHRIARRRGEQGAYYRPRANIQSRVCTLEPAEGEAAVAICRKLGFAPPVELLDFRMVAEAIPVDLLKQLNGSDILRSTRVLRSMATSVVDQQHMAAADTEEAMNDYMYERMARLKERSNAYRESRKVNLVSGRCYAPEGVVFDDEATPVFARGYESVQKFLMRANWEQFWRRMDVHDRDCVVTNVFLRYNILVAYSVAIGNVMRDLDSQDIHRKREVHEWFQDVVDQHSANSLEVRWLFDIIKVLNNCGLRVREMMLDNDWVEKFQDAECMHLRSLGLYHTDCDESKENSGFEKVLDDKLLQSDLIKRIDMPLATRVLMNRESVSSDEDLSKSAKLGFWAKVLNPDLGARTWYAPLPRVVELSNDGG